MESIIYAMVAPNDDGAKFLPVPRVPLIVPAFSGGTVRSDPLTQEEYVAIRDALPTYRDILIAKLLRASGLRIAEVLGNPRARKRPQLGITPSHLFQEEGGVRWYIVVQRGKKRTRPGDLPNYEAVYLPPGLGVELRDYIRGRGVKPGERIFSLSVRQFENVWRDAARRIIRRRSTPHSLRHLYIKYLIDHGVPVYITSRMVGHEDPRTTMKDYYALSREQRWQIQQMIPV